MCYKVNNMTTTNTRVREKKKRKYGNVMKSIGIKKRYDIKKYNHRIIVIAMCMHEL